MLNNLTIKMRLIVTLGIVGALLIAVGVMGIIGMSNANKHLDEMYNHSMVPSAQIADINRLLLRNRLAVAVALVTPTAEVIRQQAADIDSNIAEIGKIWDAYTAIPMSEDRKKLAEKFGEARKKFVLGALKPTVEMLRAGKIDAAKKNVVDAIRPMFGPVREGIVALGKYHDDAAKKSALDSAQAGAFMRNIAIAAIVIGLALAGFTGWLLIKAITVPLNAAVTLASRVARGELDNTIEIKNNDEIGKLMAALKDMSEKLAAIVTDVRGSSESIATASKQIAEGNTSLSQRTQEQASALEETASSMEEMTSTVKQNADNARQANQLVASARTQAQDGGEVVTKAVSAMEAINSSSKKIADIIGVIDEIAFQTNLLALNAAVEAARAGEQGRGFAVVATEVRNLAQRSATAAKEIKGLINDSVDKVKNGSELVDASGKALSEIVGSVKKVADIIAEIAAASQEQSSGIDQINKAVMQMDETTQQNAALVEEAASASKSMEEQAHNLTQVVSFFKTGESATAAPRAVPAHAPREKSHAEPEHKPAMRVVSTARAGSHAKPAPATATVVPAKKAAGGGGEWEEF